MFGVLSRNSVTASQEGTFDPSSTPAFLVSSNVGFPAYFQVGSDDTPLAGLILLVDDDIRHEMMLFDDGFPRRILGKNKLAAKKIVFLLKVTHELRIPRPKRADMRP